MITHSASELATAIGGTLQGDPALRLTGVNSLELAGPQEVSFAVSPKHLKEAERSRAGCLIVPPGFSSRTKTIITAAHPKLAFTKIMWLFHPDRSIPTGVHPSVVIDPSASLGADVSIGPLAIIGLQAVIGDRVRIGPGVVVGDRVRIGSETRMFPNVTLYHDVVIGARVLIHAGTVIGADGFGFVLDGDHHLKIPQLGNVVIEDDVEIGANCTIDRATFGSTIIKRGTKTDNLVHIAHNVSVGEHSLLVAQVGIAGSSKIGRYVTLAGQVGVADNVTIGDQATVGAKSAVISGKHLDAGQVFWGIPARPINQTKDQMASLALLPKLQAKLRELQQRVAALEKTLKRATRP